MTVQWRGQMHLSASLTKFHISSMLLSHNVTKSGCSLWHSDLAVCACAIISSNILSNFL